MKQTINFNNFVEAFHSMGRSEQFSYDALKAIFEYIEDYERDTGEEQELDVIGICCEFSELSENEFREYYNVDSDLSVDCFLSSRANWYTIMDNGNVVFTQF